MVGQVDSIPGLRAFVAAAEMLSYRQAGAALGVSSSAIGKAISRLEAQLSVALFHRTTRTISLTEEGMLLLDRARRVLSELEEVEADLAHATAGPRGRLRVSFPLSGSAFTPALAGFIAKYPEVEVELDYTDRLVDVIGEGFDAVLRTGPPTDSRLKGRKIADLPWMLAASPNYLLAHGDPKRPEDLLSHCCLRQRFPSGKIAPWIFSEDFEPEIPVSFTASIIDPLVELAAAGVGIICAPKFVLQANLDNGQLMEVMANSINQRGSLNILWPSSRYRIPKVRAFVDFMAAWHAHLR